MRSSRMDEMNRALSLAVLMVIGAVVGFFAAPFAVVLWSGYDHGHETEEWAVWTILGGALAGLGAHLYLQFAAVVRR